MNFWMEKSPLAKGTKMLKCNGFQAKSIRKVVLFFVLIFTVFALSAQEKTITFSADRMTGTSGKKNGTTGLEGNAVVSIETLRITGDRIELYGKDFRYVTATGNVQGLDDEKGYRFTADVLTYDRDLELASFRGNAKLLDTKHEVETTAGMIIYNQKTEIAFLQLDVKLKRKNISCVSTFATYRRTVSMLDLTGAPVVIRDGDEFRADRISVNLETEYIALDGSVSGTIKDAQKEGAEKDAAKKEDDPKETKTANTDDKEITDVTKETQTSDGKDITP